MAPAASSWSAPASVSKWVAERKAVLWVLRGGVLQAAAGAGEGGGVGEMRVAQARSIAGVDPRFLKEVPLACTLFQHFLT